MADNIPFARPTLPDLAEYEQKLVRLWETRQVTNAAFVETLEKNCAKYLGVPHCVAFGSCTSGLVLALKALGLSGKVVLPSFTFFATGHAVLWNGLEPVFADIDPDTWNLDPASTEYLLSEHEDINAILCVHVFGNPCDVEALEKLSERYSARLIFDAAHAMGSELQGRKVGSFGDVEVFSFSPTKPLVAGEGGLASTSDAQLARILRFARDYGNEGDYDPAFVGLNARLSELHAALALGSLEQLEENVRARNMLAQRYRDNLKPVEGISFQEVSMYARSTYKDVTILVDQESFGVGRDALAWHLSREGIDTRKYYFPATHRTKAYWDRWGVLYDDMLPVTNRICQKVLSLPIWSHMEISVVDRVCEAILSAYARAEEIEAAFVESSGG